MRYVIIAIALVAAGFTACAVAHHDMRGELIRSIAPSAVTVVTSDGSGSGTIIGHSGKSWLILTCEHVVTGDTTVFVETPYGRFPANVDKVDEGRDLAMLVAHGELHGSVLRVADEAPRLYERLYAVTSPLGIPQAATEGILYSKSAEISDSTFTKWAFTGFILPGSSGGTITNSDGQLVCVAEAIKRGGPLLPLIPELAFCVGLPDIKHFVSSYTLGE